MDVVEGQRAEPGTKRAPLSLGVGVAAGLKIVVAVVVYRLKKLEMANLAAAVAIAVALHLEAIDIVWRTAFAFMLNVLVYLNNDYIDVEIDLQSSDKDTAKARFLADHISAAFWAQIVLAVALGAAAVAYDFGLLIPLIAGGGVCWWYSAHLKHVPYMDILAMVIWGLTMPACGVPYWSALGWLLAVQLALFSGVFESIQVMRDADDDRQEGVRTTGVVLGTQKTLALARVIMVSVTAYAALVMHPIAALVSAGAFAVPFTTDNVERYWTRIKLVYGITWLAICAWVFFYGHTSGLLWSVARDTRLL